MTMWKLTPKGTKAVTEKSAYFKGVKRVESEILWRSATFYIETEDDEKPEFDLKSGGNVSWIPNSVGLENEANDACVEVFTFKNIPKAQERELNKFLEEHAIFELEDKGWSLDDTDYFIEGASTLEKI